MRVIAITAVLALVLGSCAGVARTPGPAVGRCEALDTRGWEQVTSGEIGLRLPRGFQRDRTSLDFILRFHHGGTRWTDGVRVVEHRGWDPTGSIFTFAPPARGESPCWAGEFPGWAITVESRVGRSGASLQAWFAPPPPAYPFHLALSSPDSMDAALLAAVLRSARVVKPE